MQDSYYVFRGASQCASAVLLFQEMKKPAHPRRVAGLLNFGFVSYQALKELPQPQVDFTLGLLNLNPEPSSVST